MKKILEELKRLKDKKEVMKKAGIDTKEIEIRENNLFNEFKELVNK